MPWCPRSGHHGILNLIAITYLVLVHQSNLTGFVGARSAPTNPVIGQSYTSGSLGMDIAITLITSSPGSAGWCLGWGSAIM